MKLYHRNWSRRRLQIILGVAGLGLLSLIAIPVGRPVFDEWRMRIPFDSAVWRARSRDAGPAWPTRLRMIDDLVERMTLIGLSRAELVTLLGEPDDRSFFVGVYTRPDVGFWNEVYQLGPERGVMRIDSEWLVMHFDDAGRVQRFAVVSD